jgi:hypothetical protein
MKFRYSQSLVALAMVAILSLLQGCARSAPGLDLPPDVERQRVSELGNAIKTLGDEISAEEAERAARIAFSYSRKLAGQYNISGSALFHNMLVNMGVRSRGLCIHWTADLITRLKQEQFQTLDLHWAIANYESMFRLEHSTVIVSSVGDSLQQGLVLDPWRNSGELFWSPTLEDENYGWVPQVEAHRHKRLVKSNKANHQLNR